MWVSCEVPGVTELIILIGAYPDNGFVVTPISSFSVVPGVTTNAAKQIR
jgi:hypothetical protein